MCAAVWTRGEWDRVCMGAITQERERFQQSHGGGMTREIEVFSKDILRENRKVESDPREDWLLLAREGQDLKESSLRKDSWKYNSQELLTLSYLCYNKLCLWLEGLIRNPVALQVCWDLIFADSWTGICPWMLHLSPGVSKDFCRGTVMMHARKPTTPECF